MQEASSGKLEAQEVGDLVNGIDPSWVLVDRIIAQQEKLGMMSCLPCRANTLQLIARVFSKALNDASAAPGM